MVFFYFTCIFRSAVLDGIFYIFYIFVLRLAVLDGIVLYFYIFVFRLAVLVLDGFVLYFILRLAVLDGIEPESVVVKFFGIFFFFFQCNSIVGHMISTGGTSNKIYLLTCVKAVYEQYGNCLYVNSHLLNENLCK